MRITLGEGCRQPGTVDRAEEKSADGQPSLPIRSILVAPRPQPFSLCARRELRESRGITSLSWTHLLTQEQPSPNRAQE